MLIQFRKGRSTLKQKRPKYMQIIDAAVVVIAENGYHQSQVSKIAKQAGGGRRNHLSLFQKQRGYSHLIVQRKNGTIHRTDGNRYPKEAICQRKKLLLLIEEHFRMLAQNHHLALVTQLELRQSNLELRQKKINEVLKGYLNMLESILTEGKKTGEFRQNLDVRLARQMVFLGRLMKPQQHGL
ncbi:fatty acid metabolism regulator protein [Bacillus safensis]|uniref:Fatty acid metabolism regulator protein n=1 Tax=Bacillus safensis TaxID=561879 RepID=A0A5S9MEG3_BACIA|nr:fatty acid metabolism regulator protein [Bacillus safensis]